MADRVPASITIGGRVTASDFSELVQLILSEALTIEWDGDEFEPSDRTVGAPLRLCAHEVAWGYFEDLEAWCIRKGLPFARWSGGNPSQWAAHRVVFNGSGTPQVHTVDEEDYTLIGYDKVRHLGTFEAIVAYFGAADWPIPPLVVAGDPEPTA